MFFLVDRDGGIMRAFTEIKLLFKIAVQFHDRVELTAHFAAKSFQRTDPLLGQQFRDLFSLEQSSRHRLPNDQPARSTFKRAVILIERSLAALRAFHIQRFEIPAHTLAFEILRLLHNLTRDLLDSLHDLVGLQLAFGHALELVLPFSGHFGRAKLRNTNAAQQYDERRAFRGRNQFAPLSNNIILRNQTLDDRGPRRRRAETFFAHRFAELFVFPQLPRAFHGGEKGRFIETRWRSRLALFNFKIDNFGRLVRRNRDQCFATVLARSRSFATVKRQPARILDNFAFGLERVFLDPRNSRRDFKLRRRKKDGDKAAHDHVVNLLLHFIEAVRRGAGRNNSKVIGNLG